MSKLSIISIDPGVNLGVASLLLDLDTRKIIVRDTHTAVLNDIAKHYYDELVECQGMQMARIIIIEDLIHKYASRWLPDFFIHETAYSAHGRGRFGQGSIESFASLRENILGIKLAACKHDPRIPVVPINPSTVKYCVLGEKNNDKNQMRDALLGMNDLDFSLIKTDHLDQHAYDAVGIGYTFIHKQVFGVDENECPKRSKNTKRNKNKSTGR